MSNDDSRPFAGLRHHGVVVYEYSGFAKAATRFQAHKQTLLDLPNRTEIVNSFFHKELDPLKYSRSFKAAFQVEVSKLPPLLARLVVFFALSDMLPGPDPFPWDTTVMKVWEARVRLARGLAYLQQPGCEQHGQDLLRGVIRHIRES